MNGAIMFTKQLSFETLATQLEEQVQWWKRVQTDSEFRQAQFAPTKRIEGKGTVAFKGRAPVAIDDWGKVAIDGRGPHFGFPDWLEFDELV